MTCSGTSINTILVFRTLLLACNIVPISKESSIMVTADDIRKCKKFSRMKSVDVFQLLAKSLAPSIHGHEYIKRALLCMLLGGLEKVLPNGTRLRGDINVLLIGDPSVAKSQLLRYVLFTAPRAVATTGMLLSQTLSTVPKTRAKSRLSSALLNNESRNRSRIVRCRSHGCCNH